jgi:hypothetical protein
MCKLVVIDAQIFWCSCPLIVLITAKDHCASKVALACLLASRKGTRFAKVIVLIIRDHYASKVVLAYLLAFRRAARFVEVRVLVAFLNHYPLFVSFLLL